MYPKLFSIGPVTVYSYGFMLYIAFMTAGFLLARELRRKKIDEKHAWNVVLLSIIGGVGGAKLFSVLEEFASLADNPAGSIFSGAGLTYHGGFIVSLLLYYFYSRRMKLKFMEIPEAAAPALMLAYGIARVGCLLAGDGDYGIPSSLPWAMAFPNGAVPTTVPVHPTPLYETISSVLIFLWLSSEQKKDGPPGRVFSLYLILSGLARFLVEIIRVNPKFFLKISHGEPLSLVFEKFSSQGYWHRGLSEAQIISAILIIAGICGLVKLRGRH